MVHDSLNKEMAPTLSIRNMAPLPYIVNETLTTRNKINDTEVGVQSPMTKHGTCNIKVI
jgi:hypothetical protein